MAKLIKDDGTEEIFIPYRKKSFDLKPLQEAVEGYIEPIYLDDLGCCDSCGKVLLVNEEAGIRPEFRGRLNIKATRIVKQHTNLALGGGYILGNVVQLSRAELGESDESDESNGG